MLFAVLLLAFLLRFYCLTCSSYWHDEGNTWALVQRSFAQIAVGAAADIHPPGYYWLLKLWSLAFGYGPWALRAFSALTGTLTVAVIYAVSRTVVCHRSLVIPLLATLLAAANPFQIYYSQEARMYSLLMLESAVLVWVVLREGKRQNEKAKVGYVTPSQLTVHNLKFTTVFALLAAAGLWTHYIFPVVLIVIGLAWLWQRYRSTYAVRNTQYAALPFLFANALALLLFLPWIPTAIDRVMHWPAGGVDVSALDGLRLTLQTLAVGPIRSGPVLAWPWLLLAGLLPLAGHWRMRRNPATPFLALWLLLPVGLMFALGLFTDSFLKFLLVASPAWCIATAHCVVRIPDSVSRREAEAQRESHVSRSTFDTPIVATYVLPITRYALALAALLLAYISLPSYYADPAARDNYAGMAATVGALGDPTADLVILNAPGQADVWRIYDPGIPVLGLPGQRPADQAETEVQLAEAVADRRQLFALFWATEQSDPEGIVEGWFNRHAFKGLESWQGNVRFVQYSLSHHLVCEDLTPPVHFGDAIRLTSVCLPPERTVVSGTSLQISLHWQTDVPITRRYNATIQLLNGQNQVVGQQDGEPGGGSLPTSGWQTGAEIVDNRAVYAPIGAPPVDYRLIVALYDAETGQRLPVADNDALQLGVVRIARPSRPLPTAIVPMRARPNRSIGPLVLVGFDTYARSFAHDPTRPLTSGESLHLTVYWQAPAPLPTNWPAELNFTVSLGGEELSAPLAGPDFPTNTWQAGDFVRGDVDIPYRADGPLDLTVGGDTFRLGRVIGGRVR